MHVFQSKVKIPTQTPPLAIAITRIMALTLTSVTLQPGSLGLYDYPMSFLLMNERYGENTTNSLSIISSDSPATGTLIQSTLYGVL